ncbi:MAG: sensor histidine kinase [Acidimicrobiia bacterium]
MPTGVWIALLWIAYFGSWSWGHGTDLNDTYMATAIVPLLAGAWIYGRRVAIATAVGFIPVQAVLFLSSDHGLGWEAVAGVDGLAGQLAIVGVTALTGFAGDAHRRLARVVSAQSNIVAAVSHEVRTPLTAVVGIAQELDANWSSIPDETRHELVGLIAEQAADMTAIVEDLLTAAKADQGKLTIEAQPVDLSEVVASVMTQLRIGPLPVKGTARAWADPQRVRQVLRNLVVNARRYGGRDIALVCGTDGVHAFVEVCDDGHGVPMSQLDQLFSPYGGTAGHQDSNGLGLAFSRQLAVMMGGNLTYRREEDRTVFRLSLPKVVAAI